jgi:hypothetical protein
MNCKQIEELLPLYAGRDLDAQSERLITAHVESCTACAAVAGEYQQSQELLQELAPPAFSEDVYAGIRQNVWRQIESEPGNRSSWEAVFDLFRPRLAWALATVVLIAVSVFGIYLVSNRLRAPQPIAETAPGTNPTVKDKEQPLPSPKDGTRVPPVTPGEEPGPRVADRRATPRRKHRSVVPESQDSLAVARSAPSQTVYTPMDPENSAQTDDGSENNSKNTLRMEIQTKNPNIRIIWFSQRETGRVSPTSKGI